MDIERFPRVLAVPPASCDPPLVAIHIAAPAGARPLQVFLAQEGTAEHPVPLSYDAQASAYLGRVAFDAKRIPRFTMRCVGVDAKGDPVEKRSRLHATRFNPSDGNIQALFASDADVTLTVDSQGLPPGTAVVWADTAFPLPPPPDRLVGAPSVTVEGEAVLAQPLILSLRFDPWALKQGTERLYRMDGGCWKEIAAYFHRELGRVTASIDSWGTFAVFGEGP